jgi:ribosomal protein S18 acetylase RimI-like enzyme
LRGSVNIRRATEKDIPVITASITKWLDWDVPRKRSIEQAIKNDELLVAELEGRVEGFIHYVLHEDIIDGGTNAFITCLYVAPEERNKRLGSMLLTEALRDSLKRGVVGVETSTANPDARRFYERHHFKQFMGKWTMGEVFLELDTKQHQQNQS